MTNVIDLPTEPVLWRRYLEAWDAWERSGFSPALLRPVITARETYEAVMLRDDDFDQAG